MTGYRAIVGLCMCCALAFSAYAVQGASAATNGTTGFTCKAVTPGIPNTVGFSKPHCRPEDAVTTEANYEHVAFAAGTTTTGTVNNKETESETTASSPSKLKVTIAGTPLELESTEVSSGSLTIENRQAANGEHYLHGVGKLEYLNVTVKKPAEKGCKVYEDKEATKEEGAEKVVKTNELTATTEGQGDTVKFQPKVGTAFATFFITCEKAVPEELTGTWTVTGTLTCPPRGATIICTHEATTTQNTLKAKGSKAGLEGSATVKVKDPEIVGDEYRPLSTTTIPTG